MLKWKKVISSWYIWFCCRLNPTIYLWYPEQIKAEIKNVGEKILAEIKITCPISNKHLTKEDI
ncbi:hypothetical protein GL982_03760 [Spiroplasma citri]|uniref:hypothetical protein n=1 Tax=Spiroplasma citri TaxID=2133 RepID=UPI0013A0814F|nr:hypothetical protein [Spiroplasma citri]QIA72812.1 hypothetical protein GL982_03760 [Spiroplasma citri]